jgi:carotenoid cleavage dioxygenase
VPRDIAGVYLRNGPNPKFIPQNGRQHWFDGDSMIHAIRIKEGKLQYSNKYTMTDKLNEEMKLERPLVLRYGEFSQGLLSLFKMSAFLF